MDNSEPPRSKNGGKYSEHRQQEQKNGRSSFLRKVQLKKRAQKRWIITAFALSFCITAVLSLGSNEVVASINVLVAIPVLLFFIFVGVLFDTIGLAVAIADVKSFNSMAARRLKAGKKAVWLITNAEKVSSFCNDLIGDIAGVMSGATGAAIAVNLFPGNVWPALIITSLIAAFTVGFKAVGKLIAVKYSEHIVLFSAKALCGFQGSSKAG